MTIAVLPCARGLALTSELEDLFREHHQLIYRTAYSVTGSRPDAEDVLQIIFLRLLRRGLPPELKKNPKGYLYRGDQSVAEHGSRQSRGASLRASGSLPHPEADNRRSYPRRVELLMTYLLTNRPLRRLSTEEHMSTANVSDVIVGASEQDVAALEQEFEGIFREHYKTVYRTAYGVTGNAQDAEDVAQTVFLRLLHGRSSRALKKNPGGYLYRAAVNESLTLIRARKRHLLTGDAERFEAQSSGAGEAAEDTHKRLYEAVAELNPGAAEILILRYVHNRSDAEIAKLLGTSRGTIAVSLYRSRARLRKSMRASSSGGRS